VAKVSFMNDLIVTKVDRARLLLAEAKDAPAAKQVADMAHAAEVYARRQKLSEESIQYAHTIKIDAMRLLGEFLKRAPKNKGGQPEQKRNSTCTKRVQVGSQEQALGPGGRKIASHAQKLAMIAEQGNGLFEEVRSGRKTLAQAYREVKREEKRRELERKAAAGTQSNNESWKIVHADCIDELAKLEPGSVRLVFADPPYNIGIDYGGGNKADRIPDHDYVSWCESWMIACNKALADDGSFWVLIDDKYAAEYGVTLKRVGFVIRSWIKWYETFGVNQANNFNRCSRHLFYCVKDPRRFVFHASAVNRPSDRQTKYGDKRADSVGKIWDDVWIIPRLVGTAKERIPDFPTQLPLELLRPIVGCSSDPGDLVLDPFSGSGTTGMAALDLGRRFIGIEKSKEFVKVSRQRMTARAS